MNKEPISNNPEFNKRIQNAKAAFTAWDKKHKDDVASRPNDDVNPAAPENNS